MTSWEHFADLKESHPIQTAEFVKIIGIDHEAAFYWWVLHVLTNCYLKRTFKFGIEVPWTVKEALAIDKKKSNTFWAGATAKEIKVFRVAFRILPNRGTALIR